MSEGRDGARRQTVKGRASVGADVGILEVDVEQDEMRLPLRERGPRVLHRAYGPADITLAREGQIDARRKSLLRRCSQHPDL